VEAEEVFGFCHDHCHDEHPDLLFDVMELVESLVMMTVSGDQINAVE
jgi:hypothetical protein